MANSHSCRWTYEEAVNYCYDIYFGNDNIKTGYHPPIATWRQAWKLLWTLHSETGNIWSHGIGMMIFIFYSLESLFNTEAFDYWIVLFFNFAHFAVFANSTFYHWLHIFGKTWHHRLYCLDFCGIGLSIHAAHLSWIYYGLYAGPSLFKIYAPIQVVILIWTLIVSYLICYSKMNVDSNQNIRIGLYLLQHFLIYVITGHVYLRNESSSLFTFECSSFILMAMACLIIGIIVYVSQVPESIWPGKFDTFFNSHQIMHLLVLMTSILERCHINCLRRII